MDRVGHGVSGIKLLVAEYQIVLPWDGLVPDNRRFMGGRGHILTKRYRAGKELCHTLAMTQVRDRPTYPEGPVWMRLDFHMPDRRRRDPNNLLKGIADALEGVVYTDDKQITKLSWENVGVDRKHPRVETSYGKHGDD